MRPRDWTAPQTLVFTKTAKLHYIRGKPAFCAWLAWWDLVLRWGLAFAKNLKILSSPFFSFLQPCSHLRGAKFFVDVFDKTHSEWGEILSALSIGFNSDDKSVFKIELKEVNLWCPFFQSVSIGPENQYNRTDLVNETRYFA